MTEAPVAVGAVVLADAFTGLQAATGSFVQRYGGWAKGTPVLGTKQLKPQAVDPADWAHEAIGWGVVLPEKPGLDAGALATAGDAPEPIRELVAHRQGKVLRYRPGTTFGDWTLRDYSGGGDLLNADSPPGRGPKQLPMYLLICASPKDVPWQVQYQLNPVRHVGRLDLDEAGLGNYVEAALHDWAGSAAEYAAPVVWSVDHGGGDITSLMSKVIAEELFAKLATDSDMPGARHLAAGTGNTLAQALRQQHPALVVTTSHGLTGPLDDPDAMRQTLGLLVDQNHTPVTPSSLIASWQPDGAIWFAQACCSVGSDQPSQYDKLFAANSILGSILAGVATVGAATSPLPRALLGNEKPLRAFIGHVEPTFDWTLSFPPNQQQLTASLIAALYDELCLGKPVGLAMSRYYRAVGALLLGHTQAMKSYAVTSGKPATTALDLALYTKITALDRASTVILGDPTAAIPPPG